MYSRVIFIIRSVHSEVPKEYFCIRCQKTFNEWRNFKRHGKEVHEVTELYSCCYCNYTTKRRHDLKRHISTKHKCQRIVASLLNDLVSETVLAVEEFTVETDEVFVQHVSDSVVELSQSEVSIGFLNNKEDSVMSASDSFEKTDIVNELISTLLNDIPNAVDRDINLPDLEQSSGVVSELSEPNFDLGEEKEENNEELPIGGLPDSDGLYEYERIRNQNVAELKAFLLDLFPPKTRKPKVAVARKKKDLVSTVATRCSSRLQSRASVEEAQFASKFQNAEECESNSDSVSVHEDEDYMNPCTQSITDNFVVESSSVPTCSTLESTSAIESQDSECDVEDLVESVDLGVNKDVLGKYCCLTCGAAFCSNNNLKRHVKLLHEVRKKPVKCSRPWCRKEYYVLDKMIDHRAKCLKVCEICLKSFKRLDRYSSHMRNHKNEELRML